jgi:hypothetical protein
MKKLFILFSFLLFTVFSFAQQAVRVVSVPYDSHVSSTDIIDGVSTHNYSAKSSIPINGTPFLNKAFQKGFLELPDGKKSDEVMLRYNIAKDVFEILHKGDTLTLNRPFAVKKVDLGEQVFIFNPKLRENAERKENGYFQVLVDGKLNLYLKRYKELSYDNFAANYKGGSGTKEYYYIDKKSFVGKTKEGKAFLITSAKKIISNLPDHKAEMKSFVKSNKIKSKRKSDLMKLVNYYNSL